MHHRQGWGLGLYEYLGVQLVCDVCSASGSQPTYDSSASKSLCPQNKPDEETWRLAGELSYVWP